MSLESLLDVLTYVQENEFNSSEVLVLIGIANYTNKQGRGARASHATLGKIVKLKDRALKLVIDRLIRRGILERISTFHRITWWSISATHRKPPEVRICRLSIQS